VTGVQNALASDDNLSSVEGMQIFRAAVQLAATTTTVASSVNPLVVGQSVTFTATVTANGPGGGTPTGTVQFQIDGINFGNPVTLSGGHATSGSISSLAVGGHTVTAGYSGDGSFATSTGSLNGGQSVQNAEAAPTVACSVAQSLLWPPNNKLANVGLSVTVTSPDVSVEVLVYATDNASPSDAADIGPSTLQLRSQRQGHGDGRVYLIVVVVIQPAATGFDVCTVVVPHDQSTDSIDAVQQQAAAAEAYYRQFQTPPAGFTLLGESGGGGAAAPPSANQKTHPGTGKAQPFEVAALLFRAASPGQPLTPSTGPTNTQAPAVPVDQAGLALDRFFASLNKQDLRVAIGQRGQEAGQADWWVPGIFSTEEGEFVGASTPTSRNRL
jgi:hypothetical protein